MMKRAFLLAGLLMSTATARADETVSVREATQLMKEGKELFGRSQFEYARQRYTKACALAPTPSCISGLAITELRAGKAVDAYRHFLELTRDSKAIASVPAATADALPKMKAEAYAQIGHVEVEAPAGVQVRLDGAVVGTAPLGDTLDIEVGDHTIDAERAREHGQVTIHAIAGQIVHASFVFEPPDFTASVPLVAAPPAASPEPATHASVLTTPREQPESPPFWTPKHTLGAIIGGVGVVALGAGGLFALAGQNATDRANALRADVSVADHSQSVCGGAQAPASCSQLEDAYSEQSRDRALSILFFAVGGAAVVAGAAVFLWPDGRATEHTAIVPMIEPHGGGFQLRRRF
jgi:hypothetical protein